MDIIHTPQPYAQEALAHSNEPPLSFFKLDFFVSFVCFFLKTVLMSMFKNMDPTTLNLFEPLFRLMFLLLWESVLSSVTLSQTFQPRSKVPQGKITRVC